jgi:hypothetical protein
MVQMASFILILFSVTISFVTATIPSLAHKGFDRDQCYQRTLDFLGNGSLSSQDEVFYRDDAGQPMSHEDNLTLTLPGCEMLCGPNQVWYQDIGPRLSIWLIPILLLLSNVELSPLDKKRFLAILHLLGDPIDSIWSLVYKIDSWDGCYHLAERYGGTCDRCIRVIATVFAGFEEVEGPRIKSQVYFDTLVDQLGFATQFHEWRRTAVELADSRTDELIRTCLAILLYIFQLISSFVKEVGGGGGGGPPGGRIATGTFLSWLVLMVLLSNSIGGFPSRRTCYDILSRFAEHSGKSYHIPHSQSVLLPGFASLTRTSSTNYYQSLGWSGAIYSYRPWKLQYVTSERRWPRMALIFFLSISPICISMAGAFVILWYSLPTGLNCRHMWLIGIFLAWLVSAFITWLSYSPRFATGKYHWRFILAKDALVAVPSIAVIILSACGLFNFCSCWSGTLYYGRDAHVPLKGNQFYELQGRTTYPLVVSVCIVLQLLVFATMAIIWRRGLKLFRWSERARDAEWERARGYKVCKCIYSREVRRPEFRSLGNPCKRIK